MRHRFPSYPVTLVAVLVLSVSFGVLLLGGAGAVPTHGVWRALVIPAWLTLTASAILRTALPVASGVPYALFMVVGIALCLLPFATIDWLIGRRRAHVVAPAP